jgi:ribosomal protein S18 acetylase RimI-like enzyme
VITEITKDDREIFLALLSEFYATDAVHVKVPAEYYDIAFREVTSGSPYAAAYIIRCDGRVAGYGQVSLTYSTEAGGLVVLLEELYIRPEFQSRGLGSEYFAFIRAKFPHAARFRLEVDEDNTDAIALYKRWGFDFMTYLQMNIDTKNPRG